jgi:hypothetical protein
MYVFVVFLCFLHMLFVFVARHACFCIRMGEDGAHPSDVSCSEGGSMFSVEGSHQGGRGWGPP